MGPNLWQEIKKECNECSLFLVRLNFILLHFILALLVFSYKLSFMTSLVNCRFSTDHFNSCTLIFWVLNKVTCLFPVIRYHLQHFQTRIFVNENTEYQTLANFRRKKNRINKNNIKKLAVVTFYLRFC